MTFRFSADFAVFSLVFLEIAIFVFLEIRHYKLKKIHREKIQKIYRKNKEQNLLQKYIKDMKTQLATAEEKYTDSLLKQENIRIQKKTGNQNEKKKKEKRYYNETILIKPVYYEKPMMGYKPYVPAYKLIDEYRPYQKTLYVKNSYNNDSLALLRYMQYQSDMTNLMMIHLNMMNRF